ncbi:MAG: radical SAM protein [Treponemataceae bacterium]
MSLQKTDENDENIESKIETIDSVRSWYSACRICPHACGVNRYKRKGFCGEDAQLRLAWAGLHFGEEPVLTAKGGSGVIFVTGCNLQCSFCQNYQISQEGLGRVVGETEFVEIALALQEAGAENINIVTGTHHAILLAYYIERAKAQGLKLPIVWNTSSYESQAIIRKLSKTVDIWLADIKTFSFKTAVGLFNTPDYVEVAKLAIETMAEQTKLRFENAENSNTEKAKLVSGLIVRHLALPDNLDDSYNLLKWFSEKLKNKSLLSLMTQYTPVEKNKKNCTIKAFENRLLNKNENETLRKFLENLEIDNGFYQELNPDYSWLPNFTKTQTFSSKLSTPIWHYTCGFIK